MVRSGVDDVACARDSVVLWVREAEIIKCQVGQLGPIALEPRQGLESLAPVEIGIGQNLSPPIGPPASALK